MSESGDTDDLAPPQSHDGAPYHSSPTMHNETQPQLGQYGSQTESMGSTTLAVTNLPYRIRWQDLKDLFRRYGTPSRADVFLAPDGRSRGVGMVSMRTRREAEGCVNDLNGYEWFGRKIGVKIDETGGHHALAAAAMAGATIWEGMSFAQDQEAPSPQLQTYPTNMNTTNPYLTQLATPVLFVGNLPFSTQWQDLKDLLRPAGRILRADIAVSPDGRSKGWGTAVFATLQEAQNAIDTFDGWEVDGRIIKVRWDKYQGSASQPSPQLAPTGSLSSPQLLHPQLPPTQTPRPNEYVAISSNQINPWQSTYPLRPMQPNPLPPAPTYVSQYANPPTGQAAPAPGQYTGIVYNPPGWYPGYNAPPHVPPMAQQITIPTSADPFNNIPHPGQVQNVQHPDTSSSHNVYGM